MEIRQLKAKNFVDSITNKILIDVRSPSEYIKGHIPGATNIPLFDDHERKIVGTLYKKQGKKEAVLKGIEFVQPKLRPIVNKVYELIEENNSKEACLYCWRGGARSESVAWLLNSSGIEAIRLEGGYKAYRNLVIDSFKKDYKLLLLGGKTGCGKTDILKELEKRDQQILDLEGIACHKGSAFGDLGQPDQPTPQQFENNLFTHLNSLDPTKIIWVENESPGIGNLFIPVDLRETKNRSPLINIELPIPEREKRITKEYGSFDVESVIKRIEKIEKKLGRENCASAIEAMKNDDTHRAVSILLGYYDKAYTYSTKKSKTNGKIIMELNPKKDDPAINAELLINSLENFESDHGTVF